MDEQLTWQMSLLDKVSAPARTATGALEKLNITLRLVGGGTGALQQIEARTRGAGSGFESLATKMSSAVNIAQSLGRAFEGVISTIGRAGLAFGEFVVAEAQTNQSTMTTLNTLLRGTPGGGRREFGDMLRLGSLLPGSAMDALHASTELTQGGFRDPRQRRAIFALQQDLAAMNPGDTGLASRLSLVFGQIRGQGRINGGDLRQLTNAGIGSGDFLEQIARAHHFTGSHNAQIARAQALVSNGQVSSDETFRALAQLTTARTGMRLGGFALAQGNSLGGLLGNLTDAPSTLLQQLFHQTGGKNGGEGTAALAPLQAMLRTLNGMLDPATERGQRLIKTADRILTAFGRLFAVDPRTLESGFDAVLNAVNRLIDAGEWLQVNILAPLAAGFGPAFTAALGPLASLSETMARGAGSGVDWAGAMRALGSALGSVVGGAIGLATAVTSAVASLDALIVRLRELGANSVTGFVQGIMRGVPQVEGGAVALATSAVHGVTSTLDMHSPSRVFAGLGLNTALGFAQGVDSGTDRVSASIGALVTPRGGLRLGDVTGGSRGASSGAGIGAVTIEQHFELPHGHESDEFAREVGAMSKRGVIEGLEELLADACGSA